MAHIVARKEWGVVDIDTTQGRIFFQQDWLYTWMVFSPAVAAWTLAEKRNFHNTLDRQIWGVWSNRIRMRVAGATDFCRRFSGTGIPINFDIRWVTAAGHWQATVRKMPAGSNRTTFRSNVTFATRRIELDTMDLIAGGAANAAGTATLNFRSGPHEFGHTLRTPDEYGAGSAHLADAASIMNIGTKVRPRHLQLIVETLNTMMPGATFSAPAAIP